jgi:hypothetical protein
MEGRNRRLMCGFIKTVHFKSLFDEVGLKEG